MVYLPMLTFSSIHFALVFVLKWTFERARHTHGMMAMMVAILNIFASSLVYVRILPIDKQVDKVSNTEKYKIDGTDPKSATGKGNLHLLKTITKILGNVPIFFV